MIPGSTVSGRGSRELHFHPHHHHLQRLPKRRPARPCWGACCGQLQGRQLGAESHRRLLKRAGWMTASISRSHLDHQGSAWLRRELTVMQLAPAT